MIFERIKIEKYSNFVCFKHAIIGFNSTKNYVCHNMFLMIAVFGIFLTVCIKYKIIFPFENYFTSKQMFK